MGGNKLLLLLPFLHFSRLWESAVEVVPLHKLRNVLQKFEIWCLIISVSDKMESHCCHSPFAGMYFRACTLAALLASLHAFRISECFLFSAHVYNMEGKSSTQTLKAVRFCTFICQLSGQNGQVLNLILFLIINS